MICHLSQQYVFPPIFCVFFGVSCLAFGRLARPAIFGNPVSFSLSLPLFLSEAFPSSFWCTSLFVSLPSYLLPLVLYSHSSLPPSLPPFLLYSSSLPPFLSVPPSLPPSFLPYLPPSRSAIPIPGSHNTGGGSLVFSIYPGLVFNHAIS